MSQLVLLLQNDDPAVEIGPSVAQELGALGVTSVSVLRDAQTTAVTLEGWAFDIARSADAAVRAVGAIPRGQGPAACPRIVGTGTRQFNDAKENDMKRSLLVAATMAAALSVGAAGAAAHGKPAGAATVSHYMASYSCDCFGTFTISGVHVTNQRFPGADNGPADATGGRDNFSGTVSQPPDSEVILGGEPCGSSDEEWISDYDGQSTCDYRVAIERTAR